MKFSIFFCFVVLVVSTQAKTLTTGNAFDTLIQKVKDMLSNSQNVLEKRTDEHKLNTCTCKTNDETFNKEIKDSKDEIEKLTAEIEQSMGKSEKLSKELGETHDRLGKAINAYGERKDAHREAQSSMKNKIEELAGQITQLNNAIQSIVDAGTKPGASLLEVGNEATRNVIKSLLALDSSSPYGAYSSQSGGVLGMLEQMQQDFSNDKEDTETEKTNEAKDFDDYRKDFFHTESLLRRQIFKLEVDLSDSRQLTSDKNQAKKEEQVSLDTSEGNLDSNTKKCNTQEREFKTLKSQRLSEQEALQKALTIMNSDEVYGAFSHVTNKETTFLQIKEDDMGAVLVKAIEEAIANIEAEGTADTKKNDECKDELSQLADHLDDLRNDIHRNNNRIQMLDYDIKDFKYVKLETEEHLKETRENFARDTATFKRETATNEKDVANFTLSHETIKKAISALQEHKSTGSLDALIALFETMEKKLDGDVSDLKNGQVNREDAFATTTSTFNDAEKKLNRSIDKLGERISQFTGHHRNENIDLRNNQEDKKQKEDRKFEITPDCDFIRTNIDSRAASRTKETEHLNGLKGVIEGIFK